MRLEIEVVTQAKDFGSTKYCNYRWLGGTTPIIAGPSRRS